MLKADFKVEDVIPIVQLVSNCILPDHLRQSLIDVVNSRVRMDDSVADDIAKQGPTKPFDLHLFMRASDWDSGRDGTKTLYQKYITLGTFIKACGNPKLNEPSVARAVSLLMYLDGKGRKQQSVQDVLAEVRTFKRVMTTLAGPNPPKPLNPVADPAELKSLHPGWYDQAYGTEPPAVCQLNDTELAIAYSSAHCRSTKKEVSALVSQPVEMSQAICTTAQARLFPPCSSQQTKNLVEFGEMIKQTVAMNLKTQEGLRSIQQTREGVPLPGLTIFNSGSPSVKRAATVEDVEEKATEVSPGSSNMPSPAAGTAGEDAIVLKQTSAAVVPDKAGPMAGVSSKAKPASITQMADSIQAKLKEMSADEEMGGTRKRPAASAPMTKKGNASKRPERPAASAPTTKKDNVLKRPAAFVVKDNIPCPNTSAKHPPVYVGQCTFFCDFPLKQWRIKPEKGSRRTYSVRWGDAPRESWEKVIARMREFHK